MIGAPAGGVVMRRAGTGTRAVLVLAALLGALVVAAVVLGVVDGRASARADDEAAACPAVRTHLTDARRRALLADRPAARPSTGRPGRGGPGSSPARRRRRTARRSSCARSDWSRSTATRRGWSPRRAWPTGRSQRAWRVGPRPSRRDGRGWSTTCAEVP